MSYNTNPRDSWKLRPTVTSRCTAYQATRRSRCKLPPPSGSFKSNPPRHGTTPTSAPQSKQPESTRSSSRVSSPKSVCHPSSHPLITKILTGPGIGTAFLALSLVEAGYDVWANTDASGSFDAKLTADANRRMEQAGVHLMGMFGISMDLMRDWYFLPFSALVVHGY